MFITFEGIDGSGKTNQVNMLADYLTNKQKNFIITREPYSEEIREFLNSRALNNQDKEDLFIADRIFHVKKVIESNLDKIIICDRYEDSMRAYQNAIFKQYPYRFPEPDITFLIDISLEESNIRLHKRNNNDLLDCFDLSIPKLNYSLLAAHYPDRMEVIDGEDQKKTSIEKLLRL